MPLSVVARRYPSHPTPAAMAAEAGLAEGAAGPVAVDGVDAIFIGFPRYFL